MAFIKVTVVESVSGSSAWVLVSVTVKFTGVIESVTDAVPLMLFIALVFLGGMNTKAKAKASLELIDL